MSESNEVLKSKIENICDDIKELKSHHDEDVKLIRQEHKELQQIYTSTIASMDKNLERLTTLMEVQVERTEKQDDRLDKQDYRLDKQDDVLNNINTEIQFLGSRVKKDKPKSNDTKWYQDIIKFLVYSVVILAGIKLADVFNFFSFIN